LVKNWTTIANEGKPMGGIIFNVDRKGRKGKE